MFVFLFLGHSSGLFTDSGGSSLIKKANVITLTKETAANSGKNFTTSLVAENIDGEVSEIGGEPIWKHMDNLEILELILTEKK